MGIEVTTDHQTRSSTATSTTVAGGRRRRFRTGRLTAAAATLAVASLGVMPAVPAQADVPDVGNGHDITVTGGPTLVAGMERTYEITMSDPAVDAGYATRTGTLAVRVTLPEDYFSSDQEYPTMYLLHGRGGNVDNWTKSGAVEQITSNSGVIVVTPEGGKASWYTNWVNQSRGAQNWEDFHINDLIPWIDDNFRTLAGKQHRAIGGLSMGGYGALHYAMRHPDLFNSVSSYSGGVDLEDQVIRAAVLGSVPLENLAPIDGTFGGVVWPFDTNWKNQNPVRHAKNFRGVGVSLYAGSGTNNADLLERGAGNSTNTLARALRAAGVPHVWDMYGRGPGLEYGCNGGHNFACWKLALDRDWENITARIG